MKPRGAARIRTGDGGFAIRCLSHLATAPKSFQKNKMDRKRVTNTLESPSALTKTRRETHQTLRPPIGGTCNGKGTISLAARQDQNMSPRLPTCSLPVTAVRQACATTSQGGNDAIDPHHAGGKAATADRVSAALGNDRPRWTVLAQCRSLRYCDSPVPSPHAGGGIYSHETVSYQSGGPH